MILTATKDIHTHTHTAAFVAKVRENNGIVIS